MADTSPDLEIDGLPHGYAAEKTVALSPGIRDLIGRIREAVGPVILETDEEETAPSAKIDELRKDLQEIEELRGELMGLRGRIASNGYTLCYRRRLFFRKTCAKTIATYHSRMIEIIDLSYLRVGAADLEEAVLFATETIGLQEVRREDDRIYVRGDERDHDICYVKGGVEEHVVGFEVANDQALQAAYAELDAAGASVERGTDAEKTDRRVVDFFKFLDPSGNRFEIVLRPFKSTRRYFPTRDAGIAEFSHVGLKTTDAPRDEKFWTTNFNIRPNDWIGDAGLLSFDAVHHRIALFPADTHGIQHINFQVDSIDDLMRSYYHLSEKQVHIVFGPGRHASSGAMFLYFEGPDGMVYEYSHGVRIIDDPNYRPRQFPFTTEAFCVWGAKPDIPEFRD